MARERVEPTRDATSASWAVHPTHVRMERSADTVSAVAELRVEASRCFAGVRRGRDWTQRSLFVIFCQSYYKQTICECPLVTAAHRRGTCDA